MSSEPQPYDATKFYNKKLSNEQVKEKLEQHWPYPQFTYYWNLVIPPPYTQASLQAATIDFLKSIRKAWNIELTKNKTTLMNKMGRIKCIILYKTGTATRHF